MSSTLPTWGNGKMVPIFRKDASGDYPTTATASTQSLRRGLSRPSRPGWPGWRCPRPTLPLEFFVSPTPDATTQSGGPDQGPASHIPESGKVLIFRKDASRGLPDHSHNHHHGLHREAGFGAELAVLNSSCRRDQRVL